MGEGVFAADVSGEDDVGETGVKGFIADGPDGDSGQDLAEDHGLFDSEAFGGDVGGGDAAFGNEEGGAGGDPLDDVDEGLGNAPGDGEIFFTVDAFAGGEEDNGFAGGESFLNACDRVPEVEGGVEHIGNTEFDGDEIRCVFEEVIELVGGPGDVGADDDEAAVGVGLEVLKLPGIEGRARDDAGEGLHKGSGGADDETAIALEEGEGENVEICEGGGVDDAGRGGWELLKFFGDVAGAEVSERERLHVDCRT